MRIGVPKGLLYEESFFGGLGLEIVNSPDTNREILDLGVEYCVDDACLPMKVFHGHVCWLRERCDAIFVPRIMSLSEREYICPKFCGLTEMLKYSIPDLPRLIGDPIYWTSRNAMFEWAKRTGAVFTGDRKKVKKAFEKAIMKHSGSKRGLDQEGYGIKVALLGHPYNTGDFYINMDLTGKLNRLGVGIITQEAVGDGHIKREVKRLFKKPFWTFARISYGAAAHLLRNGKIDGIIYVSSFACGIDSVVVDLIRLEISADVPGQAGQTGKSGSHGDLPFLVLKLDEHTGEAGFNTRIEAFVDLLGRRKNHARYHTAHGERLSCGESVV
jgi:predicted nucleotide-binding protein (sugar kinase/HSP70/actin superfamily)